MKEERKIMKNVRGLVLAIIQGKNRTKQEAEDILSELSQEILADSDDAAYRELADKVNGLLAATVGDRNDSAAWDGDESELEILTRFLDWAPDLIAHNRAQALRTLALGSGLFLHKSEALFAAEQVDTLELRGEEGGQVWYRKSDGARAPLPEILDD
jgi:hypothetical protein